MSSTRQSSPTRLSFGPFEFDRNTNDIRRFGRPVRMEGEALEVLVALLEQPGEWVTREALQIRLWRSGGDLAGSVSKLRQALGDSAETQLYVETAPGRGYRFAAPVEAAASRRVVEIVSPSAGTEGREARAWFGIRPWRAVALAGALAAAFWIGTMLRQPEPRRHTQFTVQPPAGYFFEGGGKRDALAVSPDGNRIVFLAADVNSEKRAFVRDTGALESRAVPDSAGVESAFWLTDDTFALAGKGRLLRVSRDASASHLMTDQAPPVATGTAVADEQTLLWSPGRLTMLPAGGAPQRLDIEYAWPQVLPDGRYVLHVAFDDKAGRWRARVGTGGRGLPVRELLEADSKVLYAGSRISGDGYLLFVRDGSLMAQPFDARRLQLKGEAAAITSRVFSSRASGAADFSVSAHGETLAWAAPVERGLLMWVDREGRPLRRAGPDHMLSKDARLSADGSRIASAVYDSERGATDIWVIDGLTGAARRQIVGRGSVSSPVWGPVSGPDGAKLAFLREYGAAPQMFVKAVDPVGNEQTLDPAGWQTPTDWSRDGRFIAYNYTGPAGAGQSDIWVADMERGPSLEPLIRTRFDEANAVFSPDGQWLAFTSNESGRPAVYVQKLALTEALRLEGPRLMVARQAALCLRWRADGKELFLLANDGFVYGTEVTLGRESWAEEPEPLFSVGAAALSSMSSGGGFDVSPDGKRFVIPTVAANTDSPAITVVEEWEKLLNK